MVAFYEHEGRLPADTLVFAPLDAAVFRAAVVRVVAACRSAWREGERVEIAAPGPMRSCYFARLPQLRLYDSVTPPPAADPQRAVLTLLARENPQAELQLQLERSAPDPAGEAGVGAGAGGNDWGSPAVAFIYADHRLKAMRIAGAGFALDGQPVAARHAIATFSHTRVRITMAALKPPRGVPPAASFSRRLVASSEVALTLMVAGGKHREVLHFDAGQALAAARASLTSADWSCAAAAPPPAPAARWQPAP